MRSEWSNNRGEIIFVSINRKIKVRDDHRQLQDTIWSLEVFGGIVPKMPIHLQ